MTGEPVWISRDQIIARIREDRWKLSTQTPRVEIYRQAGTSKIMNVPKKDYFPELAVIVILKTAGLTRDQRDEFLRKAVKK